MTKRILVTGSEGLIGRHLCARLRETGHDVRGLDLRAQGLEYGDTCDPQSLTDGMRGVDGVVHLAAVSRVIWGEQDPERCRRVNVEALHSLLRIAHSATHRPWVLFASSREIYGEPSTLPAKEDSPLRPMNVYGETKLAGEEAIAAAASEGLRAAVARLSNVYGCPDDHSDRVIPAFARAALEGKALRIDGGANVFDFTHVMDVTAGLERYISLLTDGGPPPPPIHFVTGHGTSLLDLAQSAVRLAHSAAPLFEAPPRQFDVARFIGDPTRASDLLGWRATTSLGFGLGGLLEAMRVRERGGCTPIVSG